MAEIPRKSFEVLVKLARRKLIRETAEEHPEMSYEDLCEAFENYDRRMQSSRSGRWWEPDAKNERG